MEEKTAILYNCEGVCMSGCCFSHYSLGFVYKNLKPKSVRVVVYLFENVLKNTVAKYEYYCIYIYIYIYIYI